jgi:tetratricopeptide (TPR) repeat protein
LTIPPRDFPKQKPNARELVIDAEEFIARGEYEKAGERLTKALETEPENVDLWIKRMDLRYSHLNDREGATEDCKIILKLAARTPLAYLYLAFLSYGKERTEHLRKVLQYDPTERNALDSLSDILARGNKHEREEALLYLKRGTIRGGDDPDLLYRQATLLHELKKNKDDLAEALRVINVAIGIKTSDTRFYDEREKIELALGEDRTEAVRSRALGYREAGDIMYRLGRLDDAVTTYNSGLRILSVFLEKESANLRDSDKSALSSDMTSMKFKLSTLTGRHTSKEGSINSWKKMIRPVPSKGDKESLNDESSRLTGVPLIRHSCSSASY